VGVKLLIEYLHQAEYIGFHINQWFSFGLIITIFAVAYWYARKQGPVEIAEDDDATELLRKEQTLQPPREITK
jgi:hypothetical protein